MMSLESSWQMPSMDLGYQFFDPPTLLDQDPGAVVPSSKRSVSRRSVDSVSTASESTNRETRRNFHRKVRTGCATCKVRHVKCDEAKPACRRCTSTGRKCDGYPLLKNQRQNAPLLPRSSSKGPVSIAPTRSRSGSEESRIVTAKVKTNSPVKSLGFFEPDEPLEQRYMDMFHLDTLPQIWRLEIPKPAVWRKLVMQLVQTEPAVRQCAIALAAAHERQKLVASGVRDDPNKLALAYYNKAIHEITDNTNNRANSTHDPVVLLTMCLLFVAIEMFLNRDGPTRIHIQSGVRILQEIEFAEHASDEEELIGSSFQALDTHAAVYPGWGASKYEGGLLTRPAMIAHGGATGAGKPIFEDLGEAIREYYSIVAEANEHVNGFANNAAPAVNVQWAARDRLLRTIAAWKMAFAELKERPAGEGSNDTSIRPDQRFLANLLELSVETQSIVLRGAFDPTQTEYDELVPEIAALVVRLRESVKSRDPESSNFSVDTLSNEVSCLWYLFCVCRDPGLRREIRELVWIARARRGAWCTMSTHLVMGRILEIEETGLIDPCEASDIPADQRIVQMCIDVAGSRRDVRIRYRYASDRVRAIEEVLKHPPRPSSLPNPPS